MGGIHLAENGKGVVMLVRCDGPGKQRGDGVAVCLGAWRQPQGDSGELTKTPHGPLGESSAAEGSQEPGEMRQILPGQLTARQRHRLPELTVQYRG